jgi:hypothetical protein
MENRGVAEKRLEIAKKFGVHARGAAENLTRAQVSV